jgi:large subunit ribosomal protein LP2
MRRVEGGGGARQGRGTPFTPIVSAKRWLPSTNPTHWRGVEGAAWSTIVAAFELNLLRLNRCVYIEGCVARGLSPCSVVVRTPPLVAPPVLTRCPSSPCLRARRMKYLAAYLLAVLGGKEEPTAADVKAILGATEIEIDEEALKSALEAVKGKVRIGAARSGGAVARARGGAAGGGRARTLHSIDAHGRSGARAHGDASLSSRRCSLSRAPFNGAEGCASLPVLLAQALATHPLLHPAGHQRADRRRPQEARQRRRRQRRRRGARGGGWRCPRGGGRQGGGEGGEEGGGGGGRRWCGWPVRRRRRLVITASTWAGVCAVHVPQQPLCLLGALSALPHDLRPGPRAVAFHARAEHCQSSPRAPSLAPPPPPRPPTT